MQVQNKFNRVLKAFGISVGTQWLNILFGFVVTPIILSLISANSYGIWMTILQIVSVIGIVDMGVTTALTHKVADPKIAEDRKMLSQVVSSGILIQVILAVSIFTLGITCYKKLWAIFGSVDQQDPRQITALLIMVVWFSISLLFGIINALLNGRQEMPLVNSIVGFSKVVTTVLVVPGLYLGLGLMSFPLSLIIPGVIGSIIMLIYLRKVIPPLSLGFKYVNWSELKKLSSFSWYWWLSKIGYLIIYSSDAIILTAIIGVSFVTPYILNSKLAFMLGMLSSQAASPSLGGISELYAMKKYDRLQEVALSMFRLSVRLGIFFTVLVICSNERLLSLWVGSKYFEGIGLTVILALICFRNTFIGGIGTLLIASGSTKAYGIVFLIEGIFKIGLAYLLIPIWGLKGLAFAHLVGGGVISLVLFPYHITKTTKLSLKLAINNGIVMPFLYSFPSVLILIILALIIPISWNWAGLIAIGSGGLIINCLCFDYYKLKNSNGMDWQARFRLIFS